MGMAFGLSSDNGMKGEFQVINSTICWPKVKADQGFSRHLESETYCSIYVFMWAAESQSELRRWNTQTSGEQ